MMKRFPLRLPVLAVALAAAGAALADDLPVKNCNWCHGSSAQGFSVAPRLAGQRADYILRELQDFTSHLRDNPYSSKYMWNAVAHLAPETAKGLADYYASLPAKAVKDGDATLVEAGRKIFEQGVPDVNIVNCIVCHGPNGQGVRDIPRLGGQSYRYIKGRLEQWQEGYHGAAKPMPLVARPLTTPEIEAVASYLSFID